jgi:hypothetical protein
VGVVQKLRADAPNSDHIKKGAKTIASNFTKEKDGNGMQKESISPFCRFIYFANAAFVMKCRRNNLIKNTKINIILYDNDYH